MNAKSTISRQKLMAMGVVAMFVMCAFAICIPADSDAGPYGGITTDSGSTSKAQKYTMDVSVGQRFTYTNIDTNLDSLDDGTITLTGSGTPSGGATVTGFGNPSGDKSNKWSVEGTFTHAGTYVYVMTATWEYTPSDNTSGGKLTQTATQQITFNILDDIDIQKTDVFGYAIKDEGAKALSLEYSGPTNFAPALTGTGSEKFSAAFNNNGSAIIITPDETVDDSITTYNLAVTVNNTNSGDSDSANINYQVFDKIAVTSEKIYTYENQTSVNGDKQMVVSWDAATAGNGTIDSYVFNFSETSTALKESTTTPGQGVINVDVTSSEPGSITGDATKKTFVGTLTVSGTLNAGEGSTTSATSSTGTYTLVVYKGLAFMSKPTIGESSTVTLGNSANNILLNSYISGAQSVTINWGDGTATDDVSSGDKTAAYYNAYHAYSKGGIYTITISATNDMGTTTSQVLYNAGEGDIEIPTGDTSSTDSDKKSFFDEHGYQFLIFAILTVLLLVAFFYFGFQNPLVIILAIVMAALAVLCFVYNDISGVIDAVKGLFNKA